MPVTFNEKFLAYLALFSGLVISVVAEYYSILGLTAIFAAAVIPVVIMGIALGVGKITATLWLKQNWSIAPWTIRTYLVIAIGVLMLITSMGIFGFLSKAHSDQSLVSGDVQAKIAVYDEKIKTAKENIDANRKALKQMDEAVDQVMGRSQDEKGADKAVALRRAQAKERTRLLSEITAEQKIVAQLSEERAPIAAEVRKVEAEVGPIKYIAAFIYGDTDQTILEKAVTWVIIILIVVFDPLAVILLLSSQISFQNFRERAKSQFAEWTDDDFEEISRDAWVADVGEKPTEEEKINIDELRENPHPVGWMFAEDRPIIKAEVSQEVIDGLREQGIDAVAEIESAIKAEGAQPEVTVTESINFEKDHPYLYKGDFWKKPEGWVEVGPLVANPPKERPPTLTEKISMYGYSTENGIVKVKDDSYTQEEFNSILEKEKSGYVQNEEQTESGVWNRVISEQEYRQKLEAKKENESNNNPNNAA